MFPHEEYLLKAMKCTCFRMIGLLNDLSNLYVSHMVADPSCKDPEKAMRIGREIQDCAKRISEIQADNPVAGSFPDDIVM
jgi:hypothetical protein